MIQDNLYLFEVYISKCVISANQEGQMSLFLRIGKTTSSFLKAKSYDNKIITFQSSLRCNCDQNALDTKRFSITLNMKGSNKQNKVLGIVMIPLQFQTSDQLKSYKISQSQDNQALIELKYSIILIDGNSNSNKKGSGINSILTPKKFDDTKKNKLESVKSSQKRKQRGSFLDTFFLTPTMNKIPTSQFIEEVSTVKKDQFQQGNQDQKKKLQESNERLLKQNEKLKRQKELLKELLKIQKSKNYVMSNFFTKTYNILAQRIVNQVQNSKNIQKKKYDDNIQRYQQAVDGTQSKSNNLLYASVGSIGQNSSINYLNENSPKSKYQANKNIPSDSKISLSKISIISQELSQLLKDSMIKDRQESKQTIHQLKKVLMDQTDIKNQRRLRSVKIKIQKSYLQLFKEQQPFTKQHIMKQKLSVSKILDQLVMCTVSP